jgi:hypothetical protein
MTSEQIKIVLNAVDQAMGATGSGPIFQHMLESRKIVLRELWNAENHEQTDPEKQAEMGTKNYDFEEEVRMWAKYPRG